jgi:NADH-quinone oxidoreductase subunit G
MTDLRILAALADALGSDLGFRNAKQAWEDFAELGAWDGDRPAAPVVAASGTADGLLLAGWRELLDASQGNDYEIALRATARPVVARVSTTTAERLGLGEVVVVEAGARTALLPLDVVDGMVDDVIWVPLNPGAEQRLYTVPGTPVAVSPVSVDEGE